MKVTWDSDEPDVVVVDGERRVADYWNVSIDREIVSCDVSFGRRNSLVVSHLPRRTPDDE